VEKNPQPQKEQVKVCATAAELSNSAYMGWTNENCSNKEEFSLIDLRVFDTFKRVKFCPIDFLWVFIKQPYFPPPLKQIEDTVQRKLTGVEIFSTDRSSFKLW
jgi:hypothetical protein